jgi:murein DD-endopeptidase MepM/ murein hydrolase activator NlpD
MPTQASPTTPLIRQSQLPKLPPTDTLSGGVQRYGASRPDGRKHAGVDFDIKGNEKFYSRIGGEVIFAGWGGSGYGNTVDIYNKDLNVTERIAEGAKLLVSRGAIVKPGTAIAQGESKTGVIHYEIRKGRSSGSGSFKGTEDPSKFLASIDKGGGVRTAQSQTLRQQASYDQRGGTIVVPAPVISGGGGQTMPSGGGGGVLPVGMLQKDVLNSYYRAQLLGFLYKQG